MRKKLKGGRQSGSSDSGKKTCSQVDVSTEAGFMHSYVVGHIGLDPSQPSILRNGDRGRRESSRQVTTPYRCSAAGRFTIVNLRPRNQSRTYPVKILGENPGVQHTVPTGGAVLLNIIGPSTM